MNAPRRFKAVVRPILKIVLLWIIIVIFIVLGIRFGVDKKVIAISVTLFGFLTNAFAGLMTLVAFIPFIGPIHSIGLRGQTRLRKGDFKLSSSNRRISYGHRCGIYYRQHFLVPMQKSALAF